MNSTELISLIAIIISVISLLISLLNYRRDRFKVIVDLDWYKSKQPFGSQTNLIDAWGDIKVRNTGRRPVFIQLIGIKYPDRGRVYNLLEGEQANGVKLNEGDGEITIRISYNAPLIKYKKEWNKLYAVAYDISGREYKSDKTRIRPEWAEQL